MTDVDTSSWKEFKLTDIGFSIYHGKRLTKEDRIPGNIPFVTAGENNFGVAEYVSNDCEIYNDAITVDMFGNCFFHEGIISGDDNIYFFINDNLDKRIKIFISACIAKKVKGQFSYTKQFRQNSANNLSILLPAAESYELDWAYMQSLISELEQERISELSAYLDAAGFDDYELAEEEKIMLGII